MSSEKARPGSPPAEEVDDDLALTGKEAEAANRADLKQAIEEHGECCRPVRLALGVCLTRSLLQTYLLPSMPSPTPLSPPVFNEDTMAKIGLIAQHTSHLTSDADRHRADLTGGASGESLLLSRPRIP